MRTIIFRRWNLFTAATLLAGAIWIFLTPGPPQGQAGGEIQAPQTGFTAPDFALQTLDGAWVSLSDLRGRPVLINFWATWCIPCQAEMPAMQRLYEEYQARGFLILAINSASSDRPEKAAAFAQEYGLTFPILLDQDDSVARDYQVLGLPTSLFVDRTGKITEVVVGGPMSEALLKVRIDTIVAEEVR